MAVAISIILLAFIWLGYETKWLTVRLPRYQLPPVGEALQAIIDIVPLLVIISFVCAACLAGFFKIKPDKKRKQEPRKYRWFDRLLNPVRLFLGFTLIAAGYLYIPLIKSWWDKKK